jgi:hypothetical protein
MITYCASDIIRQAKVVGNVSNVNMSNFDLSTTLLNVEYQKLYDKIVLSNGANIKEVVMDMEPYELPDDCYHIIGLYKNKKPISKSTIKQEIPGTYRIENNIIKYDGGPFILKYSSLPQTLTAPDKPELLDVDVAECGLVTDDGFYYKDSDNKSWFYNFSKMEPVSKDFKPQSNRFQDSSLIFDLENQTITYNETDVTYIFERENVDIVSVRVSDPYVIVNYSDARSFIFYGFEGSDQLNWNESKGKDTYGEVLGFDTNNITGKGCIWRSEDGLIYYTSFSPDTLLNYPSNTFFQLLIYRLAAVLTSINGVQNPYLTEVLIPNAEVAFEEHLAKDNVTSMRMNNDIY